MANIKNFSAEPAKNGMLVTVTYDDDTTLQFPTDNQSCNFMVSVISDLVVARTRIIAAENMAAAASRTADRLRKKTADQQPAGAGQPPQSHAEFLKLVWKAVPSFTPGVERDSQTIALDALRFVPIAVLKAVSGYELAENIPRNEAIDVLDSAGSYMMANGIKSKPYVPSINAKEAAQKRREYEGECAKLQKINDVNKAYWDQQKADEKERQKTIDKIARPYANRY